ncbi:MAG: hypothetical protein HWE10_01335 [Gammaproteobacteria bacterium]|nr:hypothetical protein [Gammaproteobacteria bacterium]
MRTTRIIRKLHKLTAGIVAVQVVLWMVSGLYMTSVPIDIVRGSHLVADKQSQYLPSANIKPMDDILLSNKEVMSIELRMMRDVPVYQLKTKTGREFLNAVSGKPLKPVTEIEAKQIAKTVYLGEGELIQANWISSDNAPAELGGRTLPVWQIQYDDFWQSTLYISAYNGEVSAARSNIWRIFDFLWMLHIMDYDEREDFNNPLVIFMASIGTLLTLSGVLMLLHAIRRQGWKFSA